MRFISRSPLGSLRELFFILLMTVLVDQIVIAKPEIKAFFGADAEIKTAVSAKK